MKWWTLLCHAPIWVFVLNNHLPVFLSKYLTINCFWVHVHISIKSIVSSGHPQGSQDKLDSERSAQASRDAWSNIGWPKFAWPWQGSPLLADQGWLSSCCLDPPQHIATAPQAIDTYYINSVTFYLFYFVIRWKASGFLINMWLHVTFII